MLRESDTRVFPSASCDDSRYSVTHGRRGAVQIDGD